MNANLLSILEQIIAEQGESVLADPQRLKALFSDYAKNEQKEERVAFGRCIEMGAYQELKKTNTADERRRVKMTLTDQINAKTGVDRTRIAEALDLLEAVMFKPGQQGSPSLSQSAFCTNCGNELQKEWASCPYCSTQVANAEPDQAQQQNANGQVLKEGVLIKTDNFNFFIEKGKLSLYRDRLEWLGQDIFSTPIERISSAKLFSLGLNHKLIIKLYTGFKYQFASTLPLIKGQKWEVEAWRDAINSVRIGTLK